MLERVLSEEMSAPLPRHHWQKSVDITISGVQGHDWLGESFRPEGVFHMRGDSATSASFVVRVTRTSSQPSELSPVSRTMPEKPKCFTLELHQSPPPPQHHQKKLKSKALLQDHAVCFCCCCCSCLIGSAGRTKSAMWTLNGRRKREKKCLRTKQCSVFPILQRSAGSHLWGRWKPCCGNMRSWHSVGVLSAVSYLVSHLIIHGVFIINPSVLERAK